MKVVWSEEGQVMVKSIFEETNFSNHMEVIAIFLK